MHSRLISAFRSLITIKLSYLVEYGSNLLLRASKWFVIILVWIVITAQQPVFLAKVQFDINTFNRVISLDKCLAGISSLTKTRRPPLYWSQSLLKGAEKPGILNWSIGKETSCFASDMTKTLTFTIISCMKNDINFLKLIFIADLNFFFFFFLPSKT